MYNKTRGKLGDLKKQIIKGLLILLRYLFVTNLHQDGDHRIWVSEQSLFPTLKSDRQIQIRRNVHLKRRPIGRTPCQHPPKNLSHERERTQELPATLLFNSATSQEAKEAQTPSTSLFSCNFCDLTNLNSYKEKRYQHGKGTGFRVRYTWILVRLVSVGRLYAIKHLTCKISLVWINVGSLKKGPALCRSQAK